MSAVRNDGGPAFPVPVAPYGNDLRASDESGMSLRDYIAIKAMQALIQSGASVSKVTPEGILTVPARQGIPPLAYEYADAMLQERAK